jgi:NAD(P)-dependent dehydrogenase (short-subunit alcohol dehydrogenase family)
VWVADLDEARARDTADRIESAAGGTGPRARPAPADVTDRASLEALAGAVFEADGRLDLCVANAGVSTMNRFLDLSDEEWDFNFAVNARGTFLTLQTFARRMARQEIRPGQELRGKLVATASMASRVAAPLLAHYSASKFAVVGLVQAAAKELAAERLGLNAVNPGFVRTSMQEREVGWEATLRGMTRDEVIADYVRQTPLGRLQEPEDVARVVAFLASRDADFLVGEVIEVNGGACTT